MATHFIPGFLPGKLHGQRSLAGYSPQGHKKSNMTEHTHTHTHTHTHLTLYLGNNKRDISDQPRSESLGWEPPACLQHGIQHASSMPLAWHHQMAQVSFLRSLPSQHEPQRPKPFGVCSKPSKLTMPLPQSPAFNRCPWEVNWSLVLLDEQKDLNPTQVDQTEPTVHSEVHLLGGCTSSSQKRMSLTVRNTP